MPKKVSKVNNDEWQTPLVLFHHLDEQYHFGFDCCASEENHKCHAWTNDFFSLILTEYKTVPWFMNPPFSKAKDCFTEYVAQGAHGVCIYRSDNLETKVWQEVILPNCAWVFFPKGRIQYEGYEGSTCMFPSALIGFGVPPPTGIEGHLLLKARW
jgi:site-specific DNA-methyltransferase (adenine-specific)